MNPQDPETFSDLGLVLMARNHEFEAGKALSLANQLRPDYAEAHHRLKLLRASHRNCEQLTHAALEILNILFRLE
ncbi:MAG: hypothetical protein KC592_19270 [Nitrospira sp.]|nr:hypothetical protein [Nitrospira sp.]